MKTGFAFQRTVAAFAGAILLATACTAASGTAEPPAMLEVTPVEAPVTLPPSPTHTVEVTTEPAVEAASSPSPVPISERAARSAPDTRPVEPRASAGRFQRFTGFVPLDDPVFVSAQEATGLSDQALVLGLDWEGEARAYPLRMMVYHHIVNDTVSGDPVLITF